MIKKWNITVFAVIAALLSSCGVAERAVPPSSLPSSDPLPAENTPSAMAVSGIEEVEGSLEQAHLKWEGTPYRWGGTTIHGIDCSAFVQVVFNKYFGMDLPRSTRQQLYVGQRIRRSSLRPGDLVFFQTGRKMLHVGIMMEGEEFLHASTSEGVTISSMDDYYWQSRYITAKRVL